jgi:type I restriction enzyme, S subunit
MSWQAKSLDELGYVNRGRSRHRPRDAAHLYGGPHPFVQTGDVKHAGLYLREHSQTYSEAGLEQSRMWPVGTLCITIAANIADTAILDIEACFPDSVIGFIPEKGKADARFVKYLFDAMLKKQFKQFTQGAAQDNLSQGKLLSLKFPIPPVALQQRIASILSAYDDLIENNRRRIQLLEQAARLLYKEWFVHLRFPGHEHTQIIDGVPEGWEKGVVSDFYDTASGGTPSRKNPEFYSGAIRWVKTQELQDGFLFDTEEHITEDAIKKSAAKLFPANTVLIAMYGATIGQVGVIVDPSTCNQACCAVMPKAEGTSYEHAFLFFLSSKDGLRNLGQGAAQKNISQQVIRGYGMILPDKLTLKLFRDYAETFLGQIRTLQAMNRQLTKARDLLLPKLMNGEVAV